MGVKLPSNRPGPNYNPGKMSQEMIELLWWVVHGTTFGEIDRRYGTGRDVMPYMPPIARAMMPSLPGQQRNPGRDKKRPGPPIDTPFIPPKTDPWDTPFIPHLPEPGPDRKRPKPPDDMYGPDNFPAGRHKKMQLKSGRRLRRGKPTHKRKFKSINALYKAMFPSVNGQFQVAGQLLGVRNVKTIYQSHALFAPYDRLALYVQQIEKATNSTFGLNTETIFNYIKGQFLITNAGDAPVNLKMWEFTFKNHDVSTNGFQTVIVNAFADSIYNPADDAIAAGLDYQVDVATNDYTDGTGNVHKGIVAGILTSWERPPSVKDALSKRLIFKGRLECNDELTVKVSSKDLTLGRSQVTQNDTSTFNTINLPTKFFLFEMQGVITHADTNVTKVGLTAPAIDYIYTESYSGCKRVENTPRIYANTPTQVFPLDDSGVVRTGMQSEANDPIS